jgi:hypothetical protein
MLPKVPIPDIQGGRCRICTTSDIQPGKAERACRDIGIEYLSGTCAYGFVNSAKIFSIGNDGISEGTIGDRLV